jgi:integrase
VINGNPAADLDHAPRRQKARNEDARQNCWTATEAKTFLTTAKDAGPQTAALYALALDSGMRKGELCGLRWQDVDFDGGKIWVVQQLTKPGAEPTFGPPKGGATRKILPSPETMDLLKAHRRAQAELKMANRLTYQDHGLVFAKEYGDLTNRADMIGCPLQSNNLAERQFDRLVKTAKVRRITFHGMRHTCATLLLQRGEPIHVVAQRLGHANVETTWKTYAHVLPEQQQQAAAAMGSILHG